MKHGIEINETTSVEVDVEVYTGCQVFQTGEGLSPEEAAEGTVQPVDH